jgi:pyruvate dehydrogenase E2 component (dihydrolipoamide acetyltransferase)
MTDIAMPRLSDSMDEGTILSWLKRDGELVRRDDELVEIETDKATMTYESPETGILQILAAEGATVAVGQPIANLGAAERAEPPPSRDPGPVFAPSEAEPPPRVSATPLARRVAREHGVDLADVPGSGPCGRITRADVVAAASLELPSPVPAARSAPTTAPAPAAPSGPAASAPAPSDATAAKGETTIVEPNRLQRVTARRMAEAKATVPHFQVTADAHVSAIAALRAQLKELPGTTPSLNDFVVKAAALALREHPKVNGSYRDEHFELHGRVNVGVAVATDDGLVVPTVHQADTLSLSAIAADVRRLAARVRDGAITPPELGGATFTVSNLGMFGMTAITPVINPPQAAILGVGAARPVLALVDGELIEDQLMTMTVSADHRILNGAEAARFLARVCELLEAPLRLAL